MSIKRISILTLTVLFGITLVSLWMLFLSGSLETVRASSHTVCPTGPPTCDFSTIQAAVNASVSGDVVTVAPGIYTETVTISGILLTLEGSGSDSTIVDGNESGSVFTINAGAAISITDMLITNGSGTELGIYTYGGGFHVSNSSLILRNCTIAENWASDGAGGLEAYDSTITVTNCTFSQNQGWWGGAITFHGGNADIMNNIIEKSNCNYGGSIFITDSSQANFINNIIMHNSCTAGIGIGESSVAVITNNTIVNNMSNGIATNTYGVGGEGTATIKNNILWGNDDDLVNLTATYSNIEDGDLGVGNISDKPMFTDPANNDYHLGFASPCIDTGNNDGAPDFDFELDFRPIDGDSDGSAIVDMGADEIPQFQLIFLPHIIKNYCPNFFDDFSDPNSGWEVVDDEYVLAEYKNGEYRVAPKEIDYIYSFPAPTCSHENYEVEVDARWASTPGGSYGILFGTLADYSRYYIYHVDTYWQEFSVARRDPSGWTVVVPWTYSYAINADTASNHLKLTRNGTQYTLEVNGINLGTWSDSSLTGSTYVGVMTYPYFEEPTYDTRFDNFSVKRLPGSGMPVQIEWEAAASTSGANIRSEKYWVIPAPEASLLFRDKE